MPTDITLGPDWQSRKDGINNAWNSANLALDSRRRGIYQSYGFDQNSGNLDVSNQYGAAETLLRNSGDMLLQDRDQEAARGFGSGHGIGAQRANLLRFQQGKDFSDLGNQYTGDLADNLSQHDQAKYEHDAGLLGVDQDYAGWKSQQDYFAQQQAQAASGVSGTSASTGPATSPVQNQKPPNRNVPNPWNPAQTGNIKPNFNIRPSVGAVTKTQQRGY